MTAADRPEPAGRAPRLWPLYAGGFLGPFGGAMVNTILPELATGLRSDVATMGSALAAYMVPFAGLMLVSGTVAGRWGRARTVRGAYLAYALASLVCILAASAGPFLAGRALQGAANAFTTPLLIAMIADLVPPGRRGIALGTYAGMQAAGQAFAPLIGGLAAEVDYRLAFAASAGAALLLAVVTPGGRAAGERRASVTREQWRALANLRLARAGGIAFTAQFASTALMVVGALVAADEFGLSPGARGLLVACFGLAGLASGRLTGAATDRYGLRLVGSTALAVLALAVLCVGVAPGIAVLVGAIAVAGVAGTGARVLTNTLGLASTPANSGGAMSMTLSAQFLGGAAVPLILPLYAVSPALTCAVAAGVAVVGLALAARPTPTEAL
ncbi:MFS transporter [Agilicoccus flavus]|uniref:MFS transporter n=1 Tax=Agilicoccus flavus TaxID=2775968 RepID=UPI001CF70024|nr:MFS transporter [Agilicoccus flavus]